MFTHCLASWSCTHDPLATNRADLDTGLDKTPMRAWDVEMDLVSRTRLDRGDDLPRQDFDQSSTELMNAQELEIRRIS